MPESKDPPLSPSLPSSSSLNNSLQLPSITQRVLNDGLAEVLLVTTVAAAFGIGSSTTSGVRRGDRREVDVAISNGPAAGTGEVDDGALRVQEQERLGAAQRQGRVGALAAGGDLGADLGGEDLFRKREKGKS